MNICISYKLLFLPLNDPNTLYLDALDSLLADSRNAEIKVSNIHPCQPEQWPVQWFPFLFLELIVLFYWCRVTETQ